MYKIITRNQVLKRFRKAIEKNPKISKTYLYKNYKKLGLWCPGKIIWVFGSLDDFAKEAGVNFYKHYIKVSKEELFLNIKKAFNENNNITKGFLYKNYKSLGLWSKNDIEMEFCNVDSFLEQAGVKLKCPIINKNPAYYFHTIGNNETFILDFVEKRLKIKLFRQCLVAGKYVDGYDAIRNIVYEVDESRHRHRQYEDKERERIIKNHIGCSFVRVDEFKFMRNIKRGLCVV